MEAEATAHEGIIRSASEAAKKRREKAPLLEERKKTLTTEQQVERMTKELQEVDNEKGLAQVASSGRAKGRGHYDGGR